jgi:hypothetical protein
VGDDNAANTAAVEAKKINLTESKCFISFIQYLVMHFDYLLNKAMSHPELEMVVKP